MTSHTKVSVLILACLTMMMLPANGQQSGMPSMPYTKTTPAELVTAPDTSQATSEASSAVKTAMVATEPNALMATEPNTLMSKERIPSGARIYVAPMANGFDNYVIAGLQKKAVPVVLVADRKKADYEAAGVAETDKAGWAKMLFLGSQQSNETASVKLVNLKTGTIVFAYSVHKTNSIRGKQSAGEACAKHIKEKIKE